MSHADDFAAAAGKPQNKFAKIDDAVICYKTTAALDIFHYYDFISRMVLVRVEQKEHINIINFSDSDRETLTFMRDKLISMGGNPPPLPAVQPDDKAPSIIKKAP